MGSTSGLAGILQAPQQQQQGFDAGKIAEMAMAVKKMKMVDEQTKKADAAKQLEILNNLKSQGFWNPEMSKTAEKALKTIGVDVGSMEKELGLANVPPENIAAAARTMGGPAEGAQASSSVTSAKQYPGGGVQTGSTGIQPPKNLGEMWQQQADQAYQTQWYQNLNDKAKQQVEYYHNQLLQIINDPNAPEADKDRAQYDLGRAVMAADPSKWNLQYEAYAKATPEGKSQILDSARAEMKFNEVERATATAAQEAVKSGSFDDFEQAKQYFSDVYAGRTPKMRPRMSIDLLTKQVETAIKLEEMGVPGGASWDMAKGGMSSESISRILAGQKGESLIAFNKRMQEETLGMQKERAKKATEHESRMLSVEERRLNTEKIRAEAALLREQRLDKSEAIKQERLKLDDWTRRYASMQRLIQVLEKAKDLPNRKQVFESLTEQMMNEWGFRKEVIKHWYGDNVSWVRVEGLDKPQAGKDAVDKALGTASAPTKEDVNAIVDESTTGLPPVAEIDEEGVAPTLKPSHQVGAPVTAKQTPAAAKPTAEMSPQERRWREGGAATKAVVSAITTIQQLQDEKKRGATPEEESKFREGGGYLRMLEKLRKALEELRGK